MSLVDRLARLFREPTDDEEPPARRADRAPDTYRSDGGESGTNADGDAEAETGPDAGSGRDARRVAVVVQAPPAGVRRYELTLRAAAAVETVEPGLLTRLFETFDDGSGVVRARAVDVDGNGKAVDAATPLFTIHFEAPVDPETVSVDGTLTGHDEAPVPWSRVRLTPVD